MYFFSAFTKTPTRMIFPLIYRLDFGQKLKPRASTLRSASVFASSILVIPQTLRLGLRSEGEWLFVKLVKMLM